MDELVVLTLHGGVETLIADLADLCICPAFLVAAQV